MSCYTCASTGVVNRDCDNCEGFGTTYDGEHCENCDGSGLADLECGSCEGSGDCDDYE